MSKLNVYNKAESNIIKAVNNDINAKCDDINAENNFKTEKKCSNDQ